MHDWLTPLINNSLVPSWANDAFWGVILTLVAVRGLVWLYCLVVTVRVAVGGGDDERGERALQVLDKLLKFVQWFSLRR